MKTLHLIRHAKSSWSEEAIEDVERPLNKRGIKSCALMAQPLWQAGCHFSHVFCSPAVRAQSTMQLLADELVDKEVKWQTDPTLYTFDAAVLMNWLQNLQNDLNDVVLVGHNPALNELVARISDSQIGNIPTCGYVQLVGEFEQWQELGFSSMRLAGFLTPKLFR